MCHRLSTRSIGAGGYGGYGSSYGQAVERYQTRYNVPPLAVRNRRVISALRTVRTPSYNQPTTRRTTGRERLVIINPRQDALQVRTPIINPRKDALRHNTGNRSLVLVYGWYLTLSGGRIPAIDDHHLVVLAVAILWI